MFFPFGPTTYLPNPAAFSWGAGSRLVALATRLRALSSLGRRPYTPGSRNVYVTPKREARRFSFSLVGSGTHPLLWKGLGCMLPTTGQPIMVVGRCRSPRCIICPAWPVAAPLNDVANYVWRISWTVSHVFYLPRCP